MAVPSRTGENDYSTELLDSRQSKNRKNAFFFVAVPNNLQLSEKDRINQRAESVVRYAGAVNVFFEQFLQNTLAQAGPLRHAFGF